MRTQLEDTIVLSSDDDVWKYVIHANEHDSFGQIYNLTANKVHSDEGYINLFSINVAGLYTALTIAREMLADYEKANPISSLPKEEPSMDNEETRNEE